MKFTVSDKVFEQFPTYIVGIVVDKIMSARPGLANPAPTPLRHNKIVVRSVIISVKGFDLGNVYFPLTAVGQLCTLLRGLAILSRNGLRENLPNHMPIVASVGNLNTVPPNHGIIKVSNLWYIKNNNEQDNH